MEQVEWGQPGYDISSRKGPQRRSPQQQQRQPWTAVGVGEATTAGGTRGSCAAAGDDDGSWSGGAGRGNGDLAHPRLEGMSPTSLHHCWA